jgi:hypothetical protein
MADALPELPCNPTKARLIEHALILRALQPPLRQQRRPEWPQGYREFAARAAIDTRRRGWRSMMASAGRDNGRIYAVVAVTVVPLEKTAISRKAGILRY